MKWHKKDKSEWHKWFAWFPVFLKDIKKTVWLEYVLRIDNPDYNFSWRSWEYRSLDTNNKE